MSERSEFRVPDGCRLRVETHGPADAPVTVVLLHGWCLDLRTWHHQIAALRPLGCRVVAFDARGHGGSSSTTLSAATLDRLGDDLAEVIKRYAPNGPIVLAGHSMGGMAIMEYAHRNPAEFAERVAGVLFVSTTAEGTTHTRYGLPPRLAMLLRAGETVGAGVLARFGPWRPHRAVMPALRPALRWLLFGDECEGTALDLTMHGIGQATLRSIGGFRPSIGAQKRLETLTDLGDVPTTVLVGDRDRLTPPECARSIADALPAAALTVFPGAGHMLLLERHEDVSATLTTIVRRAAKTAPAAKLEEAA